MFAVTQSSLLKSNNPRLFLPESKKKNLENLHVIIKKSKFSSSASFNLAEMVQKQPPIGVLRGKGVLKICSKFTGEQPCRCAISKKLQSNFFEIALRYGYSPVNLLHISEHLFFRSPLDGCF